MPPRGKGKQKAEPDADVEDEAPAAKKPKGKQKAEPDADVEDEAPAAKKTKPEKVRPCCVLRERRRGLTLPCAIVLVESRCP